MEYISFFNDSPVLVFHLTDDSGASIFSKQLSNSPSKA